MTLMPITPTKDAIAHIQAQLHDHTNQHGHCLCELFTAIVTNAWTGTTRIYPDEPEYWCERVAARLLIAGHRDETDPHLTDALTQTAVLFALAYADELTAATTHAPDQLDEDLDLFDD